MRQTRDIIYIYIQTNSRESIYYWKCLLIKEILQQELMNMFKQRKSLANISHNIIVP